MPETPDQYYYSRARLAYVALSFALSPILLYIFKLWSLPPTGVHGIIFIVALGAGLFFVYYHWSSPQLTLFNDRLIRGETIYYTDIAAIKPAAREVRLVLNTKDGHEIKTISLQWASRKDMREVLQIIASKVRKNQENIAQSVTTHE